MGKAGDAMTSAMNISVVMPAYNAAAHLREALESVVRQTYKPIETIVVDDGSTDSTAEIVRQFGSAITYVHQENRGLSAARNRGIQEARGDWIALLDADDIWDCKKLEVQQKLLAHGNAALGYTAHVVLDGGSISQTYAVPDSSRIYQALRERCPFVPSSVILNKRAAVKAGGFDETLASGPEDWDLWIRVLRRGHKFIGTSDPLLIYRVTPNGLTHNTEAFLDGQSRFVRERLTADLPVLSRWLHERKVISRLESEAAVVMREQHNPRQVSMVLRSLGTWPLPLGWNDRRYKLALHMLMHSALRAVRNNSY